MELLPVVPWNALPVLAFASGSSQMNQRCIQLGCGGLSNREYISADSLIASLAWRIRITRHQKRWTQHRKVGARHFFCFERHLYSTQAASPDGCPRLLSCVQPPAEIPTHPRIRNPAAEVGAVGEVEEDRNLALLPSQQCFNGGK